jgi:hypothetical protein
MPTIQRLRLPVPVRQPDNIRLELMQRFATRIRKDVEGNFGSACSILNLCPSDEGTELVVEIFFEGTEEQKNDLAIEVFRQWKLHCGQYT